MAEPHAQSNQNSYVDLDLSAYTGGFAKVSPSYIVSNPVNGTVTLNADGKTARFTPTANFYGMASFKFKVTGSDGTSYTFTVSVVVVPSNTVKPIKYIYNYDNSGNFAWGNVNSWTPKAVPTAIDTVIIRTGEVQIANLNHTAPMFVEVNGILRLVDTSAVNDLHLQGGTLKASISSPGMLLTSNIKVEAPSTIMAGSVAAIIFTLNGTISGSSDLTKTGIANLRISSNSSTFKGNWIVTDGKLQIRSTNGLGICGVQVKAGAVLDIEAASIIYSLVIDSTGRVDLDQPLTTDVLVLGKENVLSGAYTSSNRPSYIGSTGTLTVNSSILIASGSMNLCAGQNVQLQTLGSSTYSWKNASTQIGTGQTYAASIPGAYTISVSNANGCKVSSAAASVTVSPLPVATISTSTPTTICTGGSVVLSASTGTSYKWFNGTTQTGTAQTYTATAAGDYTVEVTNVGGCKATSSKTTVTVSSLPVATISPGSSTTLCSGASVVLSASAGSSYKWFNGTTQVGTAQTYTAAVAGDYTVEVTNASGCKALSAATTVTINTSPTGTIIASGPTVLCQGESVLLSFSSGTGYKWFNGTTQVGTSQTYTAITAGEYSAEVTNASGCKVTSSKITITVNSLPTAAITAASATTLCQGESVLLTASAGSSYKWYHGSTQVGTSQTYTATTAGDYKVEVMNASGCKAISANATIVINTASTPVISISGSTILCSGETKLITASAGTSYKWYNGATQVGTSQSYQAGTAGDYTVEVTDANGCRATSSILSLQLIVPSIPEITADGPTK